MPNLDERVATLEGRVQEQGAFMTDLRGGWTELRESITDLRSELRQSITDLRAEMERRFEQVDRRFERTDRRFETIDQRFDRMDRHFAWLVGIVVTGFVTVIGTVAGAFWSLLQIVR